MPATYPADVALIERLSPDVKARFDQYMADLDASHARLGSPYGEGSLWQLTGAECWFASFEDGITADDALDEDLNYATD